MQVSVGIQGLMRIRALYAADEAFRSLPPAKRKLLRAQHLRPLLDDFFEWVNRARTVAEGRNLPTKALGYAFNQQKELLRVLDDGRLPLDNTRSKRSLRKIVVGRSYVHHPIMECGPRRRRSPACPRTRVHIITSCPEKRACRPPA
jgi:hypothetical protein